jgi:hypothetical protein
MLQNRPSGHRHSSGAARGAATCAIAFVFLATACGGSPTSAGIARMGAVQAPTTLPAIPSGTSVSGLQSAQLAFAHCMRSHGVPDYPDPNGKGSPAAAKAEAQGELDPSSPQFQAGLKACRGLLPSGGSATPAQQAAVSAQALKFAQCMRSHGVPSFPDPGTGPRGGYFIEGATGPLSPSNPLFVKAQAGCKKVAGGTY